MTLSKSQNIDETNNEEENTAIEVSMANMNMPNDFKVLSSENLCIADAGATVHNSPRLRGINNQVKIISKEQVTVGNCEKIESKAVGELKGIVTDKNATQN